MIYIYIYGTIKIIIQVMQYNNNNRIENQNIFIQKSVSTRVTYNIIYQISKQGKNQEAKLI